MITPHNHRTNIHRAILMQSSASIFTKYYQESSQSKLLLHVPKQIYKSISKNMAFHNKSVLVFLFGLYPKTRDRFPHLINILHSTKNSSPSTASLLLPVRRSSCIFYINSANNSVNYFLLRVPCGSVSAFPFAAFALPLFKMDDQYNTDCR